MVVAVVVAGKGGTAAQASSHGWFRRRGGGSSARGARRMRQLKISSPPGVEVCLFPRGVAVSVGLCLCFAVGWGGSAVPVWVGAQALVACT